MKIVQINTFPYKATGAIMMGIHQLLLGEGEESYVVWGRGRDSKDACEIAIKDELGVKIHGLYTRLTDRTGFASQRATRKLIAQLESIKPDIIHLHNIHGYYLNIEMLFEFIKANHIKVVWTLHDCWPITGHCAYFDMVECEKWKTGCSHCPQKDTYPASKVMDSSEWNWRKKKELFTGLDAVVVTPSNWLANIVEQSFLGEYPIKVIPNGIDTEIYKPSYNQKVRDRLAPQEKPLVLGVASEWTERKGLADFISLAKDNKDIQFVVVGVTQERQRALPEELIGICRTSNVEELVELYSVADVFFNPTYEDNFPSTNLEALACGTPVVTYDTGGSPEAIETAWENNGTAVGAVIKKETSQQVDLKKVSEELHKMISAVHVPLVSVSPVNAYPAHVLPANEDKNDALNHENTCNSDVAVGMKSDTMRKACRAVALEYGKEQRLAEYIELYKGLFS